MSDKDFEDLVVGVLGSHSYELDAARVAEWNSLVENPAPPDAVPMGFSLTWFMESLVAALGGINNKGAVLLGHELDFAQQPAIGSILETTASIAELEERNGRQTVVFELESSSGGAHVATDIMRIIWPRPDGGLGIERPTTPKETADKREATAKRSRDGRPLAEGTITQEQINRYAQLSGDHNPLHLDVEGAKTSPFGTTIAHGPIALGYLFAPIEALSATRWVADTSVSSRFKSPARPGDRLQVMREGDELAVLTHTGTVAITATTRGVSWSK